MRLPIAILLLSASIATAQDSNQTSAIRFGSPTPLPRTPGQVRLATYNLENLFDSIDDPALSGQNEDMNSVKPEAQLKGLAAAIRTLDADILAVEEIESEAVLRWFRDTYLKDLGYTHLASIDAGDDRGIEQGVLSRFPIKSVRNWPGEELEGKQPEKEGDRPNPLAGQPLRFHRSPLRVEIAITPAGAPTSSPSAPAEGVAESRSGTRPGEAASTAPYTLTLFITHQKSGRFSDYWRRAEAAGLLKLVTETEKANPAANIAILGDFNAIPDDAPVQTLISGGLIDLFADLRAQGGPRMITHESGRSIDYIFINRNFQPETIASTRFILGTPARPAGVDYRTAPIPPGYGSDHYPVTVEFTPVDRPALSR